MGDVTVMLVVNQCQLTSLPADGFTVPEELLQSAAGVFQGMISLITPPRRPSLLEPGPLSCFLGPSSRLLPKGL